ncbi:CheR family methyltransferase [Polyangium jinanense]|uniref:protein-glutamate O-methyltransferase n=1 Tax=Polyangium jinanense TaxID=2829994 RepID=A0A9X4AP62_9BACT|nr:protein-glutamate O-methyltransferase CheR [Polyangium jinanense]MDC3960360.1 protein-glutamate O-methyltransferase CheR [Polyangium jinanense]MDC3978981.1 protein-glutamate O-methyltransferase CheR [Polyangium jinanense]
MNGLPISPQVFAILGALIEEKLGIHYGPLDKDLLGDKVAVRAVEAGFDSLLDYYYYLRYDPSGPVELDALADVLVVGETYFFREFDQLEALVREILVPLAEASGSRNVRVWSAACATGEEPYSMAMLLAERGLLDRVEIVASDVSTRSLAAARAGEYGPRSLRSQVKVPPCAWRFLQKNGERIVVSDHIRNAVDFRRINLLDGDAIKTLGLFDAIVCRNVLIYFQDSTARRVIDALTGVLVPNGALLVGVSESLLRLGTALRCEERGGAFVYRKVG